jgi:Icc-related predicted phosphoesterase
MRIIHISDTHGLHREYPNELFEGIDVVVHSGDCSNTKFIENSVIEIQDFLNWYKHVPVEKKIYVAGNHDTALERRKITPGDFMAAGIIYLENSLTEIDGVRFWGSPYTPTFGTWSFMKSRQNIGEVWEKMPYCDILVTHGPPVGILDLTLNRNNEYEQVGDRSLYRAVMKIHPKVHMFGHIHDFQDCMNQGVFKRGDIIFSNAACVTDGKFSLGLTSFGNIIEI